MRQRQKRLTHHQQGSQRRDRTHRMANGETQRHISQSSVSEEVELVVADPRRRVARSKVLRLPHSPKHPPEKDRARNHAGVVALGQGLDSS